jgi:hypothetical protein
MFELDMGVKKSIAIARLLEDVLPADEPEPASQDDENPDEAP